MADDLSKVFDAILDNDLATLQQILTANPALAMARSVEDQPTTALHVAAEANKRAMIAALLKAGANPNANSKYGTPLCGLVANKRNCGPAIRLLMHAGADPTLRDPKGRTPADIVKQDFRYDKDALLAILENPERVTLQPNDEIDPPVMQRNPGESVYDFYRRQWRAEKSRAALSGFYDYVLHNDESLHHRDKLIEYLGEPTDGDDACMNYVAEDEHYFVSFNVDPETGEIESWDES